jgi:arylsulfatase A-like enzyme
LRGETRDHRDDVMAGLAHFRSLRTERWKLIENTSEITELYDMREDPDETKNLADQNPQKVKEMKKRLNQRWLERNGNW